MSDDFVDWPEREAAALTLHEQERLGRQLHDTLGPQITAISMLATSLHERLRDQSAVETALAAKLLARVEQAKVEVRALAKGLIPVEVDAEGLMSAQIADQMGLSPRTVDTYRERIKAKLNLRTASELNRRAVHWVLLNE